MFKQPEALGKSRHRQLRFKPLRGYGFAAQTDRVALSLEEVGEASKHYPVLFSPKGAPVPVALLGIGGRNFQIMKNGAWRPATYLPALVRAYPFGLGKTGKAGSFAVVIDRAAECFGEEEGEPLFGADGKAGPHLQKVEQFLRAQHSGLLVGEPLVEALDRSGVLVPVVIRPKDDPAYKGAPAFRMIDRKKLGDLPDETMLAWARNGLLAIAYLHLNSMSNLARLHLQAPGGNGQA